MLYLGHVTGANGVQVHFKKIRAILNWPTPKNVTELKVFLGLCTYYKRYGKGFSQMTDVAAFHTPGGDVAKIFKPLGVSLGASLESRLSPCC